MSREFKEIMLVIGLFTFMGAIGIIAGLSIGRINLLSACFTAISVIALYLWIKE